MIWVAAKQSIFTRILYRLDAYIRLEIKFEGIIVNFMLLISLYMLSGDRTICKLSIRVYNTVSTFLHHARYSSSAIIYFALLFTKLEPTHRAYLALIMSYYWVKSKNSQLVLIWDLRTVQFFLEHRQRS